MCLVVLMIQVGQARYCYFLHPCGRGWIGVGCVHSVDDSGGRGRKSGG